jgi:hypothetical protein
LVDLHWVVVSDKVRKVFTACQLQGVQFLLVHIVIENTGQELNPYWAMNVYQEVDALHWEYTRWLESGRDHKSDPLALLDAWEVGLHYDPIRNLDIFRLKVNGKAYQTVYISARIKTALEKAKVISGFEFTPVPAY